MHYLLVQYSTLVEIKCLSLMAAGSTDTVQYSTVEELPPLISDGCFALVDLVPAEDDGNPFLGHVL